MNKSKFYQAIRYFESLSGLRFFAAILVVFHHIETIRVKTELPNLKQFSLFNHGGLAVSFFFVLSGFLITYLLFKEDTRHKTISVRKFYMRRVLRIWPVYFLMVGFGLFVLPVVLKFLEIPYEMPYTAKESLLYFVLFMPALVNILFGSSLLEPLWSIGVEEVFYLLWAPLAKYFIRSFKYILLGIIVLKIGLAYCIHYDLFSYIWKELIMAFQFEAMAIGGLGAYWIYNKKDRIEAHILFSVKAQILFLLCIIARVFFHKYLSQFSLYQMTFKAPIWGSILQSVLFIWFILNTSINSKTLFKINGKVWDLLGDLSYGIYMYHMPLVFAVQMVLHKFLKENSLLVGSVFVYIFTISGTIIVALLSKKYYEDPFLKLKKHF